MAYPVYPIIVWHPYPKEKPKEHKQYLVTVLFNEEPYVDFDDYFSYGWDDWREDEVMAWAEKPSPYEPQTDCKMCKNWDSVNGHCRFIQRCDYEPQTERSE